ncbi:MAG: hypothetical protein ACXQTS_02820 [Candidatus Methanospirareceae archaeon]
MWEDITTLIAAVGSVAAAVFGFLSWRASRMTTISEWIQGFRDIVDEEMKNLVRKLFRENVNGKDYTVRFRVGDFLPKESNSKLYKIYRLLGGGLRGDLEIHVEVNLEDRELFEREKEFMKNLKESLVSEFKVDMIERKSVGSLYVMIFSELKDSPAESYELYEKKFSDALRSAILSTISGRGDRSG